MKSVYLVSILFGGYLFFIAPLNIFVPLVIWVVAFLCAIYLDVTRDVALEIARKDVVTRVVAKKIVKRV